MLPSLETIVLLRQIISGVALAGSLFIIGAILLFQKWKLFPFRMILFLSVAAGFRFVSLVLNASVINSIPWLLPSSLSLDKYGEASSMCIAQGFLGYFILHFFSSSVSSDLGHSSYGIARSHSTLFGYLTFSFFLTRNS